MGFGHCPGGVSSLALASEIKEGIHWRHPNPDEFLKKHDPSIFVDDDGQAYLLWGYHGFFIAPLNDDFTGFKREPVEIDPSGRKIGHEGITMKKIGAKYVYIGTAWSTDMGRKGSYNLYYATADTPYGPFTGRRFLGRFLGHGTPFADKNGNWWCTAFFNGNRPPIDDYNIHNKDLSEDAQTINEQGTTIVPLKVTVAPDDEVWIMAKDPRYQIPGPDEVQKFKKNEYGYY